MKVKEESEKAGLKLNIQKTKITVSGPITSQQIDAETVADYFFQLQITADGNCSHEIKRCLLLGRKVMTTLDSIFGEGSGTPLQYSCLENPMDGGALQDAVHGAAKSRTRLSDFSFTFTFMHQRRKWQPTPVFLPGESHVQRSPGGYSPWGCRVRHD